MSFFHPHSHNAHSMLRCLKSLHLQWVYFSFICMTWQIFGIKLLLYLGYFSGDHCTRCKGKGWIMANMCRNMNILFGSSHKTQMHICIRWGDNRKKATMWSLQQSTFSFILISSIYFFYLAVFVCHVIFCLSSFAFISLIWSLFLNELLSPNDSKHLSQIQQKRKQLTRVKSSRWRVYVKENWSGL